MFDLCFVFISSLVLLICIFLNLVCVFASWQSFLNMQLYEKALDLFEDDQSTSVSSSDICLIFLSGCYDDEMSNRRLLYDLQVLMHRHLLRTTAAALVDTLFLNLVVIMHRSIFI